jgi:hypothetical protein
MLNIASLSLVAYFRAPFRSFSESALKKLTSVALGSELLGPDLQATITSIRPAQMEKMIFFIFRVL